MNQKLQQALATVRKLLGMCGSNLDRAALSTIEEALGELDAAHASAARWMGESVMLGANAMQLCDIIDKLRAAAAPPVEAPPAESTVKAIESVLSSFGAPDLREPCCWQCTPDYRLMLLCATCGNKRCPHASNHLLTCTNSNEPGQPGSVYQATAGGVAPAAPPSPPEPTPDSPPFEPKELVGFAGRGFERVNRGAVEVEPVEPCKCGHGRTSHAGKRLTGCCGSCQCMFFEPVAQAERGKL